jgi:uncharacterized phage infection (PIP) family protein YhgE
LFRQDHHDHRKAAKVAQVKTPIQEGKPDTLEQTISQIRFFKEQPQLLKDASLEDIAKYLGGLQEQLETLQDDGKGDIPTFPITAEFDDVHSRLLTLDTLVRDKPSRTWRLWKQVRKPLSSWLVEYPEQFPDQSTKGHTQPQSDEEDEPEQVEIPTDSAEIIEPRTQDSWKLLTQQERDNLRSSHDETNESEGTPNQIIGWYNALPKDQQQVAATGEPIPLPQ